MKEEEKEPLKDKGSIFCPPIYIVLKKRGQDVDKSTISHFYPQAQSLENVEKSTICTTVLILLTTSAWTGKNSLSRYSILLAIT